MPDLWLGLLVFSCEEVFGSAVMGTADFVPFVASDQAESNEPLGAAEDNGFIEACDLLDVLAGHLNFPVAHECLDHGVISEREARYDALDDVLRDAFHGFSMLRMMLRIRERLAARGWNLPVFQRHHVARLTPARMRTPAMV
jgi:hypothetical protein